MNKRVWIYLLNKYINLFLDDNLRLDECVKVFDERPFLSLDDNVVLYEEVKLLCSIYESVTYYDIEEFVFNFSQTLDNISINNKNMFRIFKILIAYLGDITNNLSKRVKTEVDAHIYTMLKEYLLYEDLNVEKTKQLLNRNTINPVNLFSLDIAESGLYEQDSIFLDSKDNLRDSISKSNYNRTRNMEKFICNTICKNYSEDEFKSFFDILISIIKEINNYKLEDLYKTRYNEILKNCNKKWSNQLPKESLLLLLNS